CSSSSTPSFRECRTGRYEENNPLPVVPQRWSWNCFWCPCGAMGQPHKKVCHCSLASGAKCPKTSVCFSTACKQAVAHVRPPPLDELGEVLFGEQLVEGTAGQPLAGALLHAADGGPDLQHARRAHLHAEDDRRPDLDGRQQQHSGTAPRQVDKPDRRPRPALCEARCHVVARLTRVSAALCPFVACGLRRGRFVHRT